MMNIDRHDKGERHVVAITMKDIVVIRLWPYGWINYPLGLQFLCLNVTRRQEAIIVYYL